MLQTLNSQDVVEVQFLQNLECSLGNVCPSFGRKTFQLSKAILLYLSFEYIITFSLSINHVWLISFLKVLTRIPSLLMSKCLFQVFREAKSFLVQSRRGIWWYLRQMMNRTERCGCRRCTAPQASPTNLYLLPRIGSTTAEGGIYRKMPLLHYSVGYVLSNMCDIYFIMLAVHIYSLIPYTYYYSLYTC